MNKKKCSKCKFLKFVSDFHRSASKQDGLQTFCKVCRLREQRNYRLSTNGKNRDKRYKERYKNNLTVTKDWNKTYLEQWLKFFISTYGNKPLCRICSKLLTFNTGNKSTTVNFDHRNGNEIITGTPCHFYRNRPCTLEHQKTWLSCDFGILCNDCNYRLPTLNRVDWLHAALSYTMESVV